MLLNGQPLQVEDFPPIQEFRVAIHLHFIVQADFIIEFRLDGGWNKIGHPHDRPVLVPALPRDVGVSIAPQLLVKHQILPAFIRRGGFIPFQRTHALGRQIVVNVVLARVNVRPVDVKG